MRLISVQKKRLSSREVTGAGVFLAHPPDIACNVIITINYYKNCYLKQCLLLGSVLGSLNVCW